MMKWFLVAYIWKALTTVGPFDTQTECQAVQAQLRYHYEAKPRDKKGYPVWFDAICVSAARK